MPFSEGFGLPSKGSGFTTVKLLLCYSKDTIGVIAHGHQHFLTAMATADGLN